MAPANRHSLHLDLPNAYSEAQPHIVALFLILFDAKAGYTIAWKRSVPELDITDSVEYKSLPSGLHNVEKDTVYFVHNDQYAGISSFINGKAAESERHALMLAVGALIPLSYGRLGKSWRHVEGLRALANELVKDPSNTDALEGYWQEHQDHKDDSAAGPTPGEGSPSAMRENRRRSISSPNGQPRTRNRAVSSASALAPPGQTLSAHHPALSLSTFLDTFGPLVFPLYKAALLRKRILLVGQAPVEAACNFVYSISILSTLPSALHSLLPLSPLPIRLRPLFSVGVHDIPTLSTGSRTSQPAESLATEGQAYGWVACTTDDILGLKAHLYDTLVTLAPSHASQAQPKAWPRIQGKPTAVNVKATQRDARRYRGLRRDLQHYHSASWRPPSSSPHLVRYTDEGNDNEATTSLLPLPSLEEAATADGEAVSAPSADDEQTVLEPQSWSALAYNSFMWWASAGEKRTDLEEESEYDSALLAHLGSSTAPAGEAHSLSIMRRGSGGGGGRGGSEEGVIDGGGGVVGFEMAVIAYFHRFTALILRTLSEVVDAQDDDEEEGSSSSSVSGGSELQQQGRSDADDGRGSREEEEEVVEINGDDMSKMGLDVWSERDRAFVEELVDFYWGRKARVLGGRVECCGVRVL
ncbi:MAG: hypothetical protein LQ348_001023 [Seirophora lacunosa]|nr:MAG: hypothetical protein LQ348_001023 [Seirophora lacunosa]